MEGCGAGVLFLGVDDDFELLACSMDVAGDGLISPAEFARYEWLRFLNEHVILVKPTFISNLQCIAKAFRRDQCGLCTLAFDYRVGGQGGAMNNLSQIAKTNTGIAQNNLGPFDECTLGCIR